MQNCIYGLGALAKRSTNESFQPHYESTIKAVSWVYQQGFKNESGQRADCEENAVSCMGKVIYYQGQANGVPPEVVKDGFLTRLPCYSDNEEA